MSTHVGDLRKFEERMMEDVKGKVLTGIYVGRTQ